MPVAEVSCDLRRCSNKVPPAEGCDAGLVAKGKRRRRVMRAGDGRELSRVNRKGPVAAWCNPLMRKTGAQHRWLGGLRILFGVSSTHAFFFEGGGLCGQCGTIREGGICELRAGASKWEECRIVFDIQVVIFGTANSNSEFHPNANIQTQCYYLRFV